MPNTAESIYKLSEPLIDSIHAGLAVINPLNLINQKRYAGFSALRFVTSTLNLAVKAPGIVTNTARRFFHFGINNPIQRIKEKFTKHNFKRIGWLLGLVPSTIDSAINAVNDIVNIPSKVTEMMDSEVKKLQLKPQKSPTEQKIEKLETKNQKLGNRLQKAKSRALRISIGNEIKRTDRNIKFLKQFEEATKSE